MRCSEFKKHMEDLVGECIDGQLKEDMETHMDNCISCREEYTGIKNIAERLKRDASSINLKDNQRKGLKEIILKAPARKSRDLVIMKRLMYVAAIFMFAAVGVYFTRGVKVNIVPSNEGPLQAQIDEMRLQVSQLEDQKQQLESDKLILQKDNEVLKKSLKEKTTTTKDWTIVNSNLGEAFIQGKVLSVDSPGKKVKLEIYKDDNTPNIDSNVTIPDGIYIFTNIGGVDEKYSYKTGSVDDLNVGDEIAFHYMGKSKSARAILLLKKGSSGS